MPLSEPSRNPAPDGRPGEILRCRDASPEESVEQAILEAGQERGSEATAGQESVGLCFSYRVLLQQGVALGQKDDLFVGLGSWPYFAGL